MLKFNLREFIALAAMSFLVMANFGAAHAADAPAEIADGVYAFAPGDGYISMFVVTEDGVIAVEPVNTAHATSMLDAIASITDQPVRYLLHSHNHWDHSGGGQVFRDAGATILAHQESYDWMIANPHPEMAAPDEGWSGQRRDITLGGTTVEMHYVGMSHGLGMTAFRVAGQNIVYVADLVTPNRVLFATVPDFNINEWKRALSEIEALQSDLVVFSHNESEELTGTMADVTATREYIEDMQAAIMAEFEKGTQMGQIPQAVQLPKYENWAMYDEWLALNVWRVMLDMHMGPFPWRPDEP